MAKLEMEMKKECVELKKLHLSLWWWLEESVVEVEREQFVLVLLSL